MRPSPKVVAVSTAALIVLAGCGSANNTGTSSPTTPAATAPATTVPPASALTATENADLSLIHEQERAGLDAFTVFAARYPTQPVFANLAASQKTQLATVTTMMSRYSLGDPSSGLAAGKYSDPGVQQLYDSTVAAGTSVDHALDAAEHFEQQHLASLQLARSRTIRADLTAMYTNLEQASNSHITACNDARQPPGMHN